MCASFTSPLVVWFPFVAGLVVGFATFDYLVRQ